MAEAHFGLLNCASEVYYKYQPADQSKGGAGI
jgi:hypothetical protein